MSGQAVDRRKSLIWQQTRGSPSVAVAERKLGTLFEGQYHEEVKAQEGQVEVAGHNLLWPALG
jgi:hypothetical protein